MNIKDGFIKSNVMGQAVVVATKSTGAKFSMLKLNDTASDIWDGIEAGKEVEEIAEGIAAKYEISLEQAIIDTREFITKLEDLLN